MVEIAEYEGLRATIRERGTLRLAVIALGLATWAIILAFETWQARGFLPLVPLTVLFATFEINLFIHTGVERIGRYLQVFHEERTQTPAWETAAMNFGAGRASQTHPLLTHVFHAATLTNLLGALNSSPSALILVLAHAAFTYRIVSAANASSGQRESDLLRFRALAAPRSIAPDSPRENLQ